MTKYHEILRLFNLGINQTGIASSCGCARKTVRMLLIRRKPATSSGRYRTKQRMLIWKNYYFLINPCQNRIVDFLTMITLTRKCCAVG